MFKCPNCDESLTLASKLKAYPKIPIYCDNCRSLLGVYHRFYYLMYVVTLYLISMCTRIEYLMWWEATGVVVLLFFVTQLLQPLRKL